MKFCAFWLCRISPLKIYALIASGSRLNLVFARAHIFAATSSAIKFLATEVCRVKFSFVKFQNLAAKIPQRRIFHTFTKYKICKANSNSEILKFRNFKIWRCKNLSARHGILPLKFHGAKFLSTKFTARIQLVI